MRDFKPRILKHDTFSREVTVIMVVHKEDSGKYREVIDLFTKSGLYICTIDPANIDNGSELAIQMEDFY